MIQEKENPITGEETPIAGVELVDGVKLFPEIESILVMDTTGVFNPNYDIEPLVVDKYKVAP